MKKISKIMQASLFVMAYCATLYPDQNSIHAIAPIEHGYDSYADLYKPLNKSLPRIGKKKKASKNLKFIPMDTFGGHQARGTYNPKQQIAIILDGQTKYHFTQVTTSRTNDIVPDGKNIDPQIQRIGFVSDKENHAGMPVTTYIFGVLTTSLPLPQQAIKQPIIAPTERTLAPLGSDPRTYAPVTFKPADKFKGDGLVGNYFAAAQVATIHDPTQQNQQSYTFNQVEKGGAEQPDGLVEIGSYTDRPQCQGNICSHAIMLVNLYGVLQNNE